METKIKLIRYINYLERTERKNIFQSAVFFLYKIYKKAKTAFLGTNNKTLSGAYLKYRHFERRVFENKISFVAIDELFFWTEDWIKKFPENYDLIVGIPRSGLFVASLVAIKIGKPLTTPELFGKQFWMSQQAIKKDRYDKILLLDDSVSNGKTIKKNLKILRGLAQGAAITTAAVIVSEEAKNDVDFYYKIVPRPRLFEWNILHMKRGVLATDLDGVICEEPAGEITRDEKKYVEWLKSAKPYLVPAFEIDAIITNRLEKYRQETGEWLSKNNIKYKKLILLNADSKNDLPKKAEHKIRELIKIKPDIFWESGRGEAEQIWKNTKIPTLCIEDKILFS